MKNLFLMMAALLAISFSACKEGETPDPGNGIPVPKTKLVTLWEYSAAWCAPCGRWGNDAFHKGISDNEGKVVPLSVHGYYAKPDGMTSKHNDRLKENLPPGHYPDFFMGNESYIGEGSINDKIALELAKPNIAQIGYKVTEDSNQYIIEARIEFFQEAEGDFRAVFYALESNIPGGDGTPAAQNGVTGAARIMDQEGDNSLDYTHNHVLRAASDDFAFGMNVDEGPFEIGDGFDVNTTIQKSRWWGQYGDVEIVAVLYKSVYFTGPKQYLYINANNVPE